MKNTLEMRFMSDLRHSIVRLTAAFLFCLTGAAPAQPRDFSNAGTGQPRAVFELFTSQGCEACLAADSLLADYARQEDVIALTYPVTIWDHLGWRDTLASPSNTARQRDYAAMRGDNKVYTPQMVVNGVAHSIGSNKDEIEKKCAGKTASAMKVPVRVASNGKEAGTLDISIGKWPGEDEPPRARVYLVSYIVGRSVPVARGENAGKTVNYAHVVQSLREIGYWHGDALDLRLFWRPAAGQGGAVLLQNISQNGPGVIYGAATLP